MTHFNVDFRYGHTTSNEAAYTVISAVQMVMWDRFRELTRTLHHVVNDLEPWRWQIDPEIGILKHCTRCGTKEHNQPQCRAHIKRCNRCVKAGREKAAYAHITKLCTR